MGRIYYTLPVLNDELESFAELDAVIDYQLVNDQGDLSVEIEYFTVESMKGNLLHFSAACDDVFMRKLFLRAKEFCQEDTRFLALVLEQEF